MNSESVAGHGHRLRQWLSLVSASCESDVAHIASTAIPSGHLLPAEQPACFSFRFRFPQPLFLFGPRRAGRVHESHPISNNALPCPLPVALYSGVMPISHRWIDAISRSKTLDMGFRRSSRRRLKLGLFPLASPRVQKGGDFIRPTTCCCPGRTTGIRGRLRWYRYCKAWGVWSGLRPSSCDLLNKHAGGDTRYSSTTRNAARVICRQVLFSAPYFVRMCYVLCFDQQGT